MEADMNELHERMKAIPLGKVEEKKEEPKAAEEEVKK